MEKNIFIECLFEAFKENDLENAICAESAEKLYQISLALKDANEKFNLTAILDDEGIILKHFVDCASSIKYIPSNANIIDVGCGAGFPSFPIAILRPDVKVTSLDSTAKKINFINKTARELNLSNIQAVTSRAENYAKENRENFDVAISRAVARLNVLNELCLPLVKKDGVFIAMKASKGDEEYLEAKNGIEILGAKLERKLKIELSFREASIEREIFIFKKIKATPTQYPRNYSQISKKPL